MKRIIIATLAAILISTSVAFAADNAEAKKPNAEAQQPAFSDVPKEHWAYSAVQQLQQMGIINGYPDGTFRGDEKVTRFELSVVLERFAEALKNGINGTKRAVTDNQTGKAEKNDSSPAKRLLEGKFISSDSPLLKDPKKSVTQEEVSQAITSVGARIIELSVPNDPVSKEQSSAQKGNDKVAEP